MPEHVEWQRADAREAIALAVQRLSEGGVVVFPTETCYVAAADALQPGSVARLRQFAPGDGGELELAVRGLGECLDWVPGMSTVGKRFASRCWPGPVSLRLDAPQDTGLAQMLPDDVRQQLCARGKLTLRMPFHESLFSVMVHVSVPIVMARLLTAEGAEVTRAADAMTTAADVIVTDGDTQFGQPATVVEVNGSAWSLARAGVVPADELARRAGCQIVFVCTGNTCRSPLAEALCKKLLAERLGCTAAELPERGYQVRSAGLAAFPGAEAAPLALETAQQLGADLSGHRTQPLTEELLMQSDHVLAMTHSHLQALGGHDMNRLASPELLSCDGDDIPDPIGGEREVYSECAQQILKHLQRRLPQFLQA